MPVSSSGHHNEQERFSERLSNALQDAGYDSGSPSRMVREFNLRFPNHAVSVHAVRKWLKGEAIPTQEKVIALSQWLGVGPEWLRFDGEATSSPTQPEQFSANDLRRLRDFQRLDDERKALVDQYMKLLLKTPSS